MQPNSAIERNRYTVYLIVFVAAFSGVLLGFNTGSIAGAILFITKDFQLTSFSTSLVMSSVLLGAFIGAVVSSRIADYYGRRQLIILGIVIYFCGTLSSAFASTVEWLILSRIIVGFALGILSYIVPLYITELAPFRSRGIMVGFNQLFIVTGILLSYAVDYIFTFSGHWRFMFGMGAIPALILLVGLMFVPESPRWLVANEKDQEARAVLRRIHGNINVELSLLEIKECLDERRRDWHMLFKPWLFPAAIVAFGMAILQQLVGIGIFVFYGPIIFVYGANDSASVAMLATFGIGVLLVLFTMIALPLIDRWGRRPLLLLGALGMTVSLLLLGTILQFDKNPATLLLARISLFAYVASFAISFGPISWLMISEMFPLRIRGLAMGLATAITWGFNMIVIFTFLPMVKVLQPSGVFWLYGGLCFLSLLFVYFLVPETKRVSLERIEANLRSGKSSRNLGE